MTTHGKYCDFDFYVTSLDAENGYAATEPMSSGLSLLEAVSEFYKRCGRYPSSTNIMLGVEYTTSRRDLEPAGKGAADLLQRVNGHLHLSKDHEQSAVLSQEGLIANNAVSFLKQQSERFYEISDKYTAECAKFISDNLPEITDDPEKFSELISRVTEEYGIERCKAVIANEYRLTDQQLLTPETADYLANIPADQNDRFRINSPPIVLDMLTAAIRKVEGLSETETKLFRSGLVNGGREQVQSQSTQVKTEIEHHASLEKSVKSVEMLPVVRTSFSTLANSRAVMLPTTKMKMQTGIRYGIFLLNQRLLSKPYAL